MALPIKTLFILLVLAAGCLGGDSYGEQYRFDYEWSEQAGGWLKYHAVPTTWDEARLRCIAEDANLVSPLTEQLKAAIITFLEKYDNSYADTSDLHIFTGVHAIFSKGDYASIEGVPLLRLAITWQAGEPDNLENSERCLAMSIRDDGEMADTRCDRVLPYVCYKKKKNTKDKLKITECGTVDPQYVMENRTGSCYKFHERGLAWSQAYQTCVAEGGYLAIINNDVEAQVLREIISKHWRSVFAYEQGHTYVGFRDWGHNGVNYMTINGESLATTYHTWHSGEPNNRTIAGIGDEGESCGSVYNDATLNDYFCGIPTGFVCEKHPKSLLSDI